MNTAIQYSTLTLDKPLMHKIQNLMLDACQTSSCSRYFGLFDGVRLCWFEVVSFPVESLGMRLTLQRDWALNYCSYKVFFFLFFFFVGGWWGEQTLDKEQRLPKHINQLTSLTLSTSMSNGGKQKVVMGGSTLGWAISKLCTLAHEVAAEIVLRMREFNHPCNTPPPSWAGCP